MKLIPVHLAWNDEHGNLDALTAIEFTQDCEFCSLETDPINGDLITITDNTFTIFDTYEQQQKNDGKTFQFHSIKCGVGNCCWDMVLMTPEECGRFAELIQSKRHWTLTVSDSEIRKHWGKMTGRGFSRYALENMAMWGV